MRQPFEVISSLMNKLDVLLMCEEITYDQWAECNSIYEDLGWTDGEICAEIDARWSPSVGLVQCISFH